MTRDEAYKLIGQVNGLSPTIIVGSAVYIAREVAAEAMAQMASLHTSTTEDYERRLKAVKDFSDGMQQACTELRGERDALREETEKLEAQLLTLRDLLEQQRLKIAELSHDEPVAD